jgi:ABC-type glucose/galactose transport system permease subunit
MRFEELHGAPATPAPAPSPAAAPVLSAAAAAAPAVASVKVDGSLVIAFVWEGKFLAATRRRMDSEQVKRARKGMNRVGQNTCICIYGVHTVFLAGTIHTVIYGVYIFTVINGVYIYICMYVWFWPTLDTSLKGRKEGPLA